MWGLGGGAGGWKSGPWLGGYFLSITAHNNSSSSWPSVSHLAIKRTSEGKNKSTWLFHCTGHSPSKNISSNIPDLALPLFSREDPERGITTGARIDPPHTAPSSVSKFGCCLNSCLGTQPVVILRGELPSLKAACSLRQEVIPMFTDV